MHITRLGLFLGEYSNIQSRNEQKLTDLFYKQSEAFKSCNIALFYELVTTEERLRQKMAKNNRLVSRFIRQCITKK